MHLAVIVLAAGKGTRMKSELPKALHRACGRSLLGWALATAEPLKADETVVVVGHGADDVVASLPVIYANSFVRVKSEVPKLAGVG